MTPAATPEALAEALAEFQRRNGYHRPEIEELLVEFGELVLATATSELARLRAEGEALKEDAARLDFLDGCNARLNASYGTHYGWKLVLNHNVNRLVLGDMKVDLHDSEGGNDKLPSCRLAIDEARRRTALARAATAREGA
jgi:hypothetical protein